MFLIDLNIQLVWFDCSGGVDHRAVGCVVGGMQGRERRPLHAPKLLPGSDVVCVF